MIERKVVNEKLQEYLVEQFIGESLSRVGYSHTQVQKTPVGEKIVIHASRPGLIVGSKGSNIKKLTKVLKTKFKFDNPQIEIAEVSNSTTNAQLIAENIAFQLEKFGPQRFKGIGYAAMENAMKGGVLGIEILISGKLPSARAKSWRFYLGYLKKCGDIAISGVEKAYTQAKLKAGVIGVQVSILPASVVLPDRIQIFSEMQDITPHAKDTGSKIEVAPEADATSNPTPVETKVEVNPNSPAAPTNIKDMAKDKKPRKPRAKKAEGEVKTEAKAEVTETPAKTE